MYNPTYRQLQVSASRKFLSAKSPYLLLAIIGCIIPWSLLLKFLFQNGLSVNLFFQKAFANNVASELIADLLICAVVFFYFSFLELRRLNLSRRWLSVYVVITLVISLSCALPLFFYFREQALETSKSSSGGGEVN